MKCETCGRIFAACIEKYIDAAWYRSCANYLKKGGVIIETIESEGVVFDDSPKNDCCNKRANKNA